jgi:hypothetical protein
MVVCKKLLQYCERIMKVGNTFTRKQKGMESRELFPPKTFIQPTKMK